VGEREFLQPDIRETQKTGGGISGPHRQLGAVGALIRPLQPPGSFLRQAGVGRPPGLLSLVS